MSTPRKPSSSRNATGKTGRIAAVVVVALLLAGGAWYWTQREASAEEGRVSHYAGRARRHPRGDLGHRHAQRDLHGDRGQPDLRTGHRRAGRLQRPGQEGPGARAHRSEHATRRRSRKATAQIASAQRFAGAGAGDLAQCRSSTTTARPTSASASWSPAATSISPAPRSTRRAAQVECRAGADRAADRVHPDHAHQPGSHRDPLAGRRRGADAHDRARPDRGREPAGAGAVHDRRRPRQDEDRTGRRRIRHRPGQSRAGRLVHRRCLRRPPVQRQGRAGAPVGDDDQQRGDLSGRRDRRQQRRDACCPA